MGIDWDEVLEGIQKEEEKEKVPISVRRVILTQEEVKRREIGGPFD